LRSSHPRLRSRTTLNPKTITKRATRAGCATSRASTRSRSSRPASSCFRTRRSRRARTAATSRSRPSGKATRIQLGIHIFYRPFRDWAFGANFLFDPKPTSDSEYGGLSGLSRTHSRAYFFIGGEGRYIPLHWRSFEGFVGAQTGMVIVADRFTTNAGIAKPAIFGDREYSLSTEGFFIGAQIGFDWYISDRVVAGLVTRYNHWVLPEQPKCSPILDCTTLTGGVDSIDFGFTLGYRISL
jgi:hypothetical protein